MKVYQLVEQLKRFDQELDIVVDGYEGGTEPITVDNIGLKYVDQDGGMDYCGDYGDAEDDPTGMTSPLLVVIIGRYSYG